MLQRIPSRYMKPSDALYCYIYDAKTSTIGKLKIKNYKVSLSYRGDGRNFSFKSPKTNTMSHVEEKYIGIMRSNRVYLYEDNDSKALGIIYKAIDAETKLLESKLKDLQSQTSALKTKPHEDIFKNYWED